MVDTAVVLAAGEGTRLRPLTRNRPKPMLPAANRPILEHVLDALVDAGAEDLVVVVGYKHDRVQNHFGPTYRDVPITYVRQNKQLGTGHALLQAREHVEGSMLVVNGDCLIDSTLVEDVCRAFDRGDGEPTLAVLEGPDARQYGAVTLRDGLVQELIEKPRTDEYRLINAGIYAFDDDIFGAIDDTPREAGELALTTTLSRELDDGRVRGVETDGLWVDASYPWDLLVVAAEILDYGLADEPERDDRVWVDETAIVHDDATLQPPVVIGPDCEIGPSAVVGPHSALGRNVTVGANATVANSVLDVDARVGAGSTLLDTVTGQHVRLGPNSVVSGGPADVRVGNEIFEDEDLGAVIADRVRADGNVGFAPGSLVGPNAHLDTGVTVDGQVREGTEVRR
ncbi:bifunctional sugar-1-phosphate nucleotidylyltransferase/acetyltransferase [Halapricum desulfuricans]|uniref:Bifunctional protein GlmU n=1 Tax=Halapricum desulfuricans TaxID=2841257 RepID=A0A897NTX4_9EURY|nr:bifunctional sugar-1-phosphate nucleotidylyltransferase/acetyltransferase [Halapricum desulfuricans]QSG14189.1 N-acetylglucosamine-1-phosphate uridyltransferase [Halapricum desulfuricans]